SKLRIASYNAHHGEEAPLSGTKGSGTIFLSHCSLRCVFCINADISHGGVGSDREIEDMAGMMMVLQEKGCHNINVVTPTHFLPHIMLALDLAAGAGLNIPFVYNTCGWERLEILRELDGVVDIYLPDFKYWDAEIAKLFSAGAESYPKVTMKALIEMNRQVGTAHPGPDGLMERGLMIRHLVMPNGVSGSENIMRWIASNLPEDTYINIMSQYTPAYRAREFREISRRLKASEYRSAVRAAREAGLTNLDIQGAAFMID
ncbi:MAG TPA: radical SAM protein, partial [Candidatus Krumholzibacterium sp.]|nr:radical SAM protein [Candidatus Krumholzibacterium sp.]